MLTTAITFAASKKVIALAAASGVAASAMFAGNTSLQQEIRAMPAPILIEADLGSMLRLGGGSGTTAGVTIEADAATEAADGVSLGTVGSLLTEVSAALGTVDVTVDATGTAATEADATAGTGVQVDLGLSTEAAVEADATEAGIVADAGGVLGVTLR